MRYVYLVRCGSNQYKVGVAGDIVKRMKGLQTSNGNLVELVTCKRTPNARDAEKEIHKKLHEQQLNGGTEWFMLTYQQAIETAVEINKLPFAEFDDIEDLKVLVESSLAKQQKVSGKLEQLLGKIKPPEKAAPYIKPDSTQREKKHQLHQAKKEAEDKELFEDAVNFVRGSGKASTSGLQRNFGIGYGRAARLIDQMEAHGIVGPPNGAKMREVLYSNH